MKTFAFIFARGGSKGVPKKNIKDLCGKPLIAYSINIAKKIAGINEVFVSTEDETIANISETYGAKVIERPMELAGDKSPEYLAWKHAIKFLEAEKISFDRFISLPTTSPLRDECDIINALNLLDQKTDFVVTMTEANRNPYFNMLKIEQKGYAKMYLETEKKYTRRQDVPNAFDMTTVAYVSRPESILKYNHIFEGRVKSLKIPTERALDIDTEFDFFLAQLLMENRINVTK